MLVILSMYLNSLKADWVNHLVSLFFMLFILKEVVLYKRNELLIEGILKFIFIWIH